MTSPGLLDGLSARWDRVVTRLVLITVVAGLVAAALGALLVWVQARGAVRSEIAARTAAVAEELAVRLDTRVEGVAGNLRMAATIPVVADTDPKATPDLRAVLAASPTFDELILFDAEGRPVAATAARFLAVPSDYPDRPGLAGLAPEAVHVTVVDEFPPVLEVAVPIESPPGRVTGALLARLPLELLAAHISQPDPGTDATAFLVGRDGRYLVHPSRDLVAQGHLYLFPEGAIASIDQAVIERDGGRYIIAVAPTLLVPGAVVLEAAEAEALAPVRLQLTQLGLTVVAVIAATVVGVALAGRRLLRPLDPLSEAVSRLERGERGVRVDAVATGEIGALIRQLNGMSAALDRRNEEVGQMHQLSLLVTSRAERVQVGEELVAGARRLLDADVSAFFAVDDHGGLRLETSTGDRAAASSLRPAAEAAARSAAVEQQEVADGSRNALAIPVAGMDGTVRGVLAVMRAGAYADDEARLAEAFGSFAGVALQNVQRLEYEQALVRELEDAIEVRRDLMGRVSHDLRVPIVGIESFAARLRREWERLGKEQRDEIVASISEQAEVLDDLVSKLLEYSAPSRSRRPVSLAPVALRPIVAAALDSVEGLIGDRPVQTDVDDVDVEADSALLTRALSHLVSNAIRYSPAGSPVRLVVRREGETARIDVTDQGSGLSDEEQARVFEPFWRRVVEGQERAGEGIGLGLTLVAEYTKAMNGTLEVLSEPGRGSTFSVRLPVARTESLRLRT